MKKRHLRLVAEDEKVIEVVHKELGCSKPSMNHLLKIAERMEQVSAEFAKVLKQMNSF